MDRTDKNILSALQRNGRLTVTELADQVNLSISPCHRRMRALEASGAIRGYHADLDAHTLEFTFEALLFVSMNSANRDSIDAFEAAAVEVPYILQAQRLFGEPDYLLRVIAPDQRTFQQIYDDQLATLPGVQKLVSTLVMKNVVENRPLPL